MFVVLCDESKSPTTSWKKADIKSWLIQRGIDVSENMLKAELLEVTRLNKPPKTYLLDKFLESRGHLVG